MCYLNRLSQLFTYPLFLLVVEPTVLKKCLYFGNESLIHSPFSGLMTILINIIMAYLKLNITYI